MREDMYKVIVERPRKGGLYGGARQFRNDEERGGKIGMKQGYNSRKWLNENLAPLKRWLASQINRPWSKVYAELCANIDRRNTVQEHIFAHIDQFVERDTRLVNGEVRVPLRWTMHLVPLSESKVELYVHPRTGILLRNRHRFSYAQDQKIQKAAKARELNQTRRELSDWLHLRKLDGVWYAVTLEKRPEPEEVKFPNGQSQWKVTKVWDVLEREQVAYEIKRWHSPEELVYAKHKRQLSGAELKQYKLQNDNAGKSGVVLCGTCEYSQASSTRYVQPSADPSLHQSQLRSLVFGLANRVFVRPISGNFRLDIKACHVVRSDRD